MRFEHSSRALRVTIALLAAAAAGCTAGGVSYQGGIGYGMDYYEPYGPGFGYYDYGFDGWGPGYWIGPPAYVVRPRPFRPAPRGGPGPGRPPHAWRPPPPNHSMPSIPTRPSFTPHRGADGRRR